MIGTFKAVISKTLLFLSDGRVRLELTVPKENVQALKDIADELAEGEEYRVTIDRKEKKKTLEQNAYLWVLLERIAKKIKSTKEDVYREFIRRVGVFDTVCLQDKAVDRFVSNWNGRGIGWQCDLTDSKLPGCTNVLCYYGTSCYSREELSRLIDEVTAEAKELKIPTDVVGYKEEHI